MAAAGRPPGVRLARKRPVVTPSTLRCGGILLSMSILVATARAEPAEPDPARKAEARAHLKRGAELIDAEDLPGALAQFEAAYRLVPTPAIFHNFGVVYQGLGKKAAALDAFQRFLDEADKAPPAAREHAQRAVEALRGEVAELQVECDVAGATILVDGQKVGETPQGKALHLDPGSHRLSVEKVGLAAHAQALQAAAGQRLTVPARLSPPPAPVAQVSEPTPSPAARSWQRPAAWTATAAATVATGVFATFLVVRHSRVKAFNDAHCGTGDTNQGGGSCPGLRARADDASKWAVASGLTAGALAAGAAVFFLTLPETKTAVSLDPSPSYLGLRLQGRF